MSVPIKAQNLANAPQNAHPQTKTDNFVPALIVIDMQNDFVYGSLAVPGGESIIDPINDLINLPFKLKVATRDFHPDNHVSFARTHARPVLEKAVIYHPEDHAEKWGVEQVLWPVHCVAYTGGADFVPGLNSVNFDAIIHKGTHPRIESYSAFRDIWGKGETELPKLLKENGITDIYLCGLAGDYCVKYTAIDSAEYGYRTWIINNAIKSVQSDEALWMDAVDQKNVRFTTVDEVTKLMTGDRTIL